MTSCRRCKSVQTVRSGGVGVPGPTGADDICFRNGLPGRVRAPGPTGAVQTNRYHSFRPAPSAAHCYARKSRAKPAPNVGEKEKDRRTGLNCGPRALAARPTGVAADRKVRGSRKRGYRKPGRKSGCPVPPFANPGCHPAAVLPPPKAAHSPHAAACALPAAEGGKKHPPSLGENLLSPDWGLSRLLRQGRRNGGTFACARGGGRALSFG